MKGIKITLYSLAIISLNVIGVRIGQSEEPPSRLTSLQGSFEREMNRVRAPVISKYLAVLAMKTEIDKIEKMSLSKEDADELESTLRKFVLRNEFTFFFFPTRSKEVTFSRDRKIRDGGNLSEYAREIKNGELYMANDKKETTFIFTCDEKDQSFPISNTTHKYMSRNANILFKKQPDQVRSNLRTLL